MYHTHLHSRMLPHTLAACVGVHNDFHIPKHAQEHTQKKCRWLENMLTDWENVICRGQVYHIVMSFTKITLAFEVNGPHLPSETACHSLQ